MGGGGGVSPTFMARLVRSHDLRRGMGGIPNIYGHTGKVTRPDDRGMGGYPNIYSPHVRRLREERYPHGGVVPRRKRWTMILGERHEAITRLAGRRRRIDPTTNTGMREEPSGLHAPSFLSGREA